MAVAHAMNNLEKLTEENFDSWKLQMKSVLVYNELWAYVNGTKLPRNEDDQEWSMKNEKALALIVLSVSKGQLSHIKKPRTAKEAWDQLTTTYESRGLVKRATLYKQLYRTRKEPGMAMSKYISEFTTKAEQLEEAGITIPADLLSIMMLGSLPIEYENFRIAIESRDEIPNIEALKSKLIEEEARQNDKVAQKDTRDNALVSKNKTSRNTEPWKKGKINESKPRKFEGKCFKCDKIGHRSRDCRTKSKGYAANKADDALVAVAHNAEEPATDIWCLDSGATSHMCKDKTQFSTLNEEVHGNVQMAADQSV